MPAFPGLHPHGDTPLTDGNRGLELVRILEASSESLKRGGAPVELAPGSDTATITFRPFRGGRRDSAVLARLAQTKAWTGKNIFLPSDPKLQIKSSLNAARRRNP